MKKIYYIITAFLFLIPSLVGASSIDNISMNIYIDTYGTAHVTEEWSVYINEGTEGYKPYYNLGSSRIENFSVTLDGKKYDFIDSWNTDSSFASKSYKNGFNYLEDGIELCFGISSYGRNNYTLTYDITNFVVNTSDGYQMVYWTLFPYSYSPSPDRVYIKIYSDFNYPATLDVWGFGKGNVPTYVYDGYIEMDSEGRVSSSEYMAILVKFPQDTFTLSTTVPAPFADYLDMASSGSRPSSLSSNASSDFMDAIVPLLTFVGFFTIFTVAGATASREKYGKYHIKFGKEGRKISKDEAPYFRDLPYHKEDLAKAYWISCEYRLISKKTDYLGALLLKWLKDGNITIKKEGKNPSSHHEDTTIVFNNCKDLSEVERQLYEMMYTSSNDGILEKKEFEVWCKKNYQKILAWFDRVIDTATESFIADGLLIQKGTRLSCTTTEKMRSKACEVYGLKRFLEDFSNIKDRSAIEVQYWEEYLMYAQIFGIAKKVMKEFKNLYPDIITEELYDDIDFIYLVSYNGINSATTAQRRANEYSSGGGGYSSFGGGSGSFGGGGGGGGGFR